MMHFTLTNDGMLYRPPSGCRPLTSDNPPLIWPQSRPPRAGYIIPSSSLLLSLLCAMCNNNRSTVCLFNFSACFSNEIQTDDAHKPVFIGTIVHCTYSFWGQSARPPPGLCPWTPLGDFRPLNPLLSRYTPCHYILYKGWWWMISGWRRFEADLTHRAKKGCACLLRIWYCWICSG